MYAAALITEKPVTVPIIVSGGVGINGFVIIVFNRNFNQINFVRVISQPVIGLDGVISGVTISNRDGLISRVVVYGITHHRLAIAATSLNAVA